MPLTLLGVAVIFFVAGFFFGYKTKVNNSSAEVNISSSSLSLNSSTYNSSTKVSPTITLTNTSDVFWIKVGTNPVCPETHPIKGKFDSSTAKFYYTTDNKNYDRVRPDICFTTENFAKDTAGFVKKF